MTKKQKYATKKVEEYLYKICDRLNIKTIPIYVGFKSLSRNTNAESIYYASSGKLRILFDKRYITRMPHSQIRRTACHETCHCISFSIYQDYRDSLMKMNAEDQEKNLHGEKWQELMKLGGVDYSYYVKDEK